MIVKHLDDVAGTDREVSAETWTSRRLLLAADGMGFSMHDTVIESGTVTEMCYRNHLEAVYCIEGVGVIEDIERGATHPIRPGTLYALDKHDKHVLRAGTRLRLVCVFNPPCTGREVHGADGAYPLLADEPQAVSA